MAIGLVAVPERAENGSPLLLGGEDEELRHVARGMGIVFGEGALQQPGTLYVTTRRLIWFSDDDHQKGYAVDFKSLSMHAISRDPEAYPVPCIYTQIESAADEEDWESVEEGDEELLENENHVEEDLSTVSEMRLVPREPNGLDQLFQVLCDCALLNPDSDGEQEGEGEFFFNVNEVLGRPIGEDDTSGVPNIAELQIQDPRFEDAEEELEDES
ncbi:unnamed protein product [Calypogeia fissa]